MATDLEELKTSYSQIVARIKEVTASTQPTYSLDGVSVSRAEYLRTLMDEAKAMKELIQIEEPYWFTSQTL